MADNEELNDEIEAISAIYPDCVELLTDRVYKIKVPNSSIDSSANHEDIQFVMSFPLAYPAEKPFIIDVAGGYDEKYLVELFGEVLDSVWVGDVVIFDLLCEISDVLYQEDAQVEEVSDVDHWSKSDTSGMISLRDQMESLDVRDQESIDTNNDDIKDTINEPDYNYNYVYDDAKEKAKAKNSKQLQQNNKKSSGSPFDGWSISDPIIDRKSTFVAFAKSVSSVKEAEDCLYSLLEDKKIARATHAMRAWRIKHDKGFYQDCDDDGETAAGGRMLHLLTVMNAENIIAVCVRWFGGIHLGPDRFKHINNATRDAIFKGNLVVVGVNKKKKKK